MRKCAPEDAKGAWKELAIYETGTSEVTEQRAKGAKYLVFGDYNTLMFQRVQAELPGAMLLANVRQSNMQYIMTADGMFFSYQSGALLDSLLCYVATEATQKFAKDTLLLARPVEKDKPLIINLFAPLK